MDPINLSKSYDPAPIEDKRYQLWLDAGLFTADPSAQGEPFSVVIPPPNVTGALHMGHALNNTLQDVTCRTRRMQGYNVLWVPGTDHAGIATQNVVERNLAGKGVTRQELGREAFVEKVWEWKEQYGSRIINQLKKLGSSCDWSRERFTMDEGLSEAVRRVFVELYEKGLIYRGKYLINWCPRCHTALSDLEVEHQEAQGKLYEIAYPFVEGDGHVVVQTTRPETMLGDTAIAVHPSDERHAHLVGRRVVLPLVGRVIPIIADNMVDPEFGSGLVKITPAHDPNDFLVGQRHGLEQIQVIDGEGKMLVGVDGQGVGMDRLEAREMIVAKLEQTGALLRTIEHLHSLGHCYRCSTVIEPYLSEQWFVRAKPLADAGVAATKEGRIRFVPEQWEGVYFQWMEQIRDWCISRQLWWGHRIPAWYCEEPECSEIVVAMEAPSKCPRCGSTHLRQDEDVLDTWFSSALWPFSTMGWPHETDDLKRYYPTALLVTAFDIIFFWVARMIMFGIEFMGDVPFKDVYIHALVRDENGQKMSKSKGNVIDPLEIIEQYGADALRLTLAALTVQGRDIFLSANRIETYRFFLNKLWNASRFALLNLQDAPEDLTIDDASLRLHDRWILARTREVIGEMTRLQEGYFVGEAARLMYDFVWSELCDWYLELSKPALRGDEGVARKRATQAVLLVVFKNVLKLLHPIIPFATEELWNAFPFVSEGAILLQQKWPLVDDVHKIDDAESVVYRMDFLREVVRVVRNLRAEARLTPQQPVAKVVLLLHKPEDRMVIEQNADLIRLLTRVEELDFMEAVSRVKPPQSLAAVFAQGELFMPVGDLLDLEKETARLRGEAAKIQKEIERAEKKLANEEFLKKAPAEVVEKEHAQVAEGRAKLARIEENIKSFSAV